jgi:hypothetical protein
LKDLRKDRPQILLHEPNSTEKARINESVQNGVEVSVKVDQVMYGVGPDGSKHGLIEHNSSAEERIFLVDFLWTLLQTRSLFLKYYRYRMSVSPLLV